MSDNGRRPRVEYLESFCPACVMVVLVQPGKRCIRELKVPGRPWSKKCRAKTKSIVEGWDRLKEETNERESKPAVAASDPEPE